MTAVVNAYNLRKLVEQRAAEDYVPIQAGSIRALLDHAATLERLREMASADLARMTEAARILRSIARFAAHMGIIDAMPSVRRGYDATAWLDTDEHAKETK